MRSAPGRWESGVAKRRLCDQRGDVVAPAGEGDRDAAREARAPQRDARGVDPRVLAQRLARERDGRLVILQLPERIDVV